MNTLQKLLDEKFPITAQTSEDGRRLYEVWKDVFTEGYNAAKAEGANPTKLELASLMIAQGGLADGSPVVIGHEQEYSEYCVRLAKSILEEANK